MPTAKIDDAAIREQAYLLWEQEGRPQGRENEYWMRAKVALSEGSQMNALVEPAPKRAAKPGAAATKARPASAKAEAARKPKKKK